MNKNFGWVQKAFGMYHMMLVGGWLVVLYVSSVWLVLGTLSSYQFQQKVKNIKVVEDGRDTGRYYSIADLMHLTKTYDLSQQGLSEAREAVLNLETVYEQTVSAGSRQERERIAKRLGKAGELSEKVSASLDEVVTVADLPEESKQSLLRSQHSFAIKTLRETGVELGYLERTVEELILNQASARANEDRLATALTDMLAKLKRYDVASQSYEKEAVSEDLRSYLSELRYLTRFEFDLLATMPTELLTLILTLSMGGLGSVIYLTRALFDPSQKRPFIWYFSRPFLGMVTALAIFVLVKSGQIVFSSTSGPGIFNSLNPFFISFLAIISGLLSEQAYEKIEAAGQAFFKVEKQQGSRFAIRLREFLEEEGKKTEELAEFLNVPRDTLEKWIREEQAVPEEGQKIIAAFLRKPARTVFTDQAPKRTETKEPPKDSQTETPPAASRR